MNKILIVEDDSTIRRGISMTLKLEDYLVTEADTGTRAIEKLKRGNYNLVILDVMLPELNGYEVLRYIRENSTKWIPVIMLTAKSDEDDKILGLDEGADDYMTKPFSNRELVARIRANLRQQEKLEIEDETNLPFQVDLENYNLVFKDGKESLTKKELLLMTFLINNLNKFLSKEEILENVWGSVKSTDTRTVDIHISKLRKKLTKHETGYSIKTKHGVGYGLRDENED